MARTNNLTNFLTDVASAIKTKKGDNTAIQASAFDTEILALPAQGTYQQKSVTISANGTTTLEPDQDYDAMDQVTITVQVPVAQLQTKTYQFTQNTTIQLLPDNGYDGFDQVNLEINVPSQQINNQNKTITQNGTYTADSGYTGLGEVIVSVPSNTPSNIYKFASLQEAQAKNDYNVGDIAVVMGEKRVPFYPAKWKKNYVNSNYFMFGVNSSVTLEANTNQSWSGTFDVPNGSKSTTYTVSIEITPTSAAILLPQDSLYKYTYRWSSVDGIHYTYIGANDNMLTYRQLMVGIGNYLLSFLETNWSECNILSKFFSYANNDIINRYYRYDGDFTTASTNSFYPYDLSTICIGENNLDFIDILPQSNQYVVNSTWMSTIYSQLSPSGQLSFMDVGDYIYITSGNMLPTYDISTDTWYWLFMNTPTLYQYNKNTNTVSSLELTDTFTVYDSTASEATGTTYKRLIDSNIHANTAVIYRGTINSSGNISSTKGPFVYVMYDFDSKSYHTSDLLIQYTLEYIPSNLGLIAVSDPTEDEELYLANSILGVN